MAVLGGCLVMFASGAQAQVLDATVQAEKKINDQSAQSQKRVSSLARQTQDLLTEYRSVVRETEAHQFFSLGGNFKKAGLEKKEDLQDILGISAEPDFIRVFRHERAIPQYVVGHAARLQAMGDLAPAKVRVHDGNTRINGETSTDS